MRQVVHVFKKDVRHLWIEIAVVMVAVAGFALVGALRAGRFVDAEAGRPGAWTLVLLLLPLAWWMLISRAIHSEALPGDRQFWITRPYAWKSLLLAKILFIVVFINTPMLIADAVILRAYGLHPLGAQLPGLVWNQVMLSIVYLLPIATLSALTDGLVQLIFAVLAVCVIALLWFIASPQTALGGAFFGPFEWVKSYYALLVIAIGSLAILVWQYSRRHTAGARALAGGILVLAIAGTIAVPWRAAFVIQSLVSGQQADSPYARVEVDSGDSAHAILQPNGRVHIVVPLDITGLPKGAAAKIEAYFVTLEAPDGTLWRWNRILPMSRPLAGHTFAVETTVSRLFYEKVRDGSLKTSGSLYLTLFGDPQTSKISLGDGPVTVPRVGACSASRGPDGPPSFLQCSSGFRFPEAQVTYHFLHATPGGFQTVWSLTQRRLISYAPFPPAPGIDPISQDVQFSIVDAPVSEASVGTVVPIAYLRRSFRSDSVKLTVQ